MTHPSEYRDRKLYPEPVTFRFVGEEFSSEAAVRYLDPGYGGPSLQECMEKFDQFTSFASVAGLEAELYRRQGLANTGETMNVAGDADCDDSGAAMQDDLDDAIKEYRESRHKLALAARRVHLSVQFFQGMEEIMSGAAADVIQALAVFKDHLKDNDAAAQAIIAIAKAAPTNAEMVQIKSAVADMQAGVDADTAAMNEAAGVSAPTPPADTGTGDTTPPADTGTSGATPDSNTF